MSKHQFKAGMMALAPVRVEFCHGFNIECTTRGVHGVRAEDGERIDVHSSVLLPAPREGEYRLTVEELYRLVSDFVHECTDAPFFGDFPEENIEFIKQWLANRKEAGND